MASDVIDSIVDCLEKKQDFLLSGGAGSGKTTTLIQTLQKIFLQKPNARVACITFTNAAVNEIKNRTDSKNLNVSTIHEFLWNNIKIYQKNLKETIIKLIDEEKKNKGSGISYSGDIVINVELYSKVAIEYKEYRNLEKGVISHNDVLIIANRMFSDFQLLCDIVCDKYDYILVDEYQDTHNSVIEIFLLYLKRNDKKNNRICFFGDEMQSIYDWGVGNLHYYIEKGVVKEIIKDDNYRCSKRVIGLLNQIRSNITQKPGCDNKEGSIKFVFTQNSQSELKNIKTLDVFKDWDFSNNTKTKELYLTHRLIAFQMGFPDLFSAYNSLRRNEYLFGEDKDWLARQLFQIQDIIFLFKNENFKELIKRTDFKIKKHADVGLFNQHLIKLSTNLDACIDSMIELADSLELVKIGDQRDLYLENHLDLYDAVKNIHFSQVSPYYNYVQEFSPYSTQHNIKGTEFDNVLVILDNGNWNQYNFYYLFENTPGKESIIQRTSNLFYVCCSRAKENLVLFYNHPSEKILDVMKNWFGVENIYEAKI